MGMTHLSLFSGIGGLDLAAEWAGFETVGQCEFADYPTKVLEKHWPDVPRWRDIRTLTKDSFYERTGLRTVDVISGGFPCQPFSVAGKQKGKGDDRYLWPEMLRVIRELAPRWVVGENVPGILRIAGKTVCEDLEREGYAVTVFNYEAAAVGAHHRRDRIFVVANSAGLQRHARPKEQGILREMQNHKREHDNSNRPSQARKRFMADTNTTGLQRCEKAGNTCGGGENGNKLFTGCCDGRGWRRIESRLGMLADGLSYWLGEYLRVEPDIPRVATGVKNRVEQLKCYGNAVVPQQAYPIFNAIAEVEFKEVHNV
jgi:DNA (cytosine-5)-methyltransferase 1